jgi:hypothetical protein
MEDRMRTQRVVARLFSAFALVLVLTVVLQSSSMLWTAGATTEPLPGGATPAVATPVSPPFSTTDGAWNVIVTSTIERNAMRGQPPQGRFIVVFLDVTNTSKQAEAFPYGDLVITDDKHNQYTHEVSMTEWMIKSASGLSAAYPVEPEQTIHTAVVFDVAANATALILTGSGWPAPIPIAPV